VRRRISNAARTTFRSLNIRNFRLFFIGQLISQTGTWLTTIAQTLLVLHLTNSGVAIGGLVACQFGPVLFLGAWAGVVADRHDKRKLLLLTQTLEMLQSCALAILAFLPHPSLIGLYAVASAGAFMLAFDNPARRSFVPEIVPRDNVQNAATLNSAIMTSARIFGPALGGLLVVTLGYGWCFSIDAASYLAVLVALFMMRPSEFTRGPVVARAKGQIRAGLRYTRRMPDLFVPLVMLTVVGTLTFNFAVVIPLFVEHTLKGNDTTYTLLYSVLSIGSLAGALVASYQRIIEVRHVAIAAFAFGIAMCVFALAPSLAFAFPIAILVGLTSVGFLTTGSAIVQVRSDPDMRGRVLALQSIVMIGSTPIGGPILGYICDTFGARVGIAIGAAAALGAGAWGLLVVRRIRDRAGTDDATVVIGDLGITQPSDTEAPVVKMAQGCPVPVAEQGGKPWQRGS
jgi:MFS family permease